MTDFMDKELSLAANLILARRHLIRRHFFEGHVRLFVQKPLFTPVEMRIMLGEPPIACLHFWRCRLFCIHLQSDKHLSGTEGSLENNDSYESMQPGYNIKKERSDVDVNVNKDQKKIYSCLGFLLLLL